MINEFKVKGKELLSKIEELIHEGNVRRIIIKDNKGKTFIEIPLTIGVVGTLAAPIMAAVGALAGIVADFTVEIIRKEDVEENADAVTNVKDAEFVEETKEND